MALIDGLHLDLHLTMSGTSSLANNENNMKFQAKAIYSFYSFIFINYVSQWLFKSSCQFWRLWKIGGQTIIMFHTWNSTVLVSYLVENQTSIHSCALTQLCFTSFGCCFIFFSSSKVRVWTLCKFEVSDMDSFIKMMLHWPSFWVHPTLHPPQPAQTLSKPVLQGNYPGNLNNNFMSG